MKRTFLVAGLAWASAACTAGLDVEVDVMNPAYAKAAVAETALLNDANELAMGGHVRADRVVAASLAQWQAFRSACLDIVVKDQTAKERKAADEVRLASLDKDQKRMTAAKQEEAVYTKNISRLQSLQKPAVAQADANQLEATWRKVLYDADDAARRTMGPELAQFVGLSGWESPQANKAGARWSTVLSTSIKLGLAERQAAYDAHVDAVKAKIDSTRDVECVGATVLGAEDTKTVEKMEAEAKAGVERAEATSVIGGGTLLNAMTEAFFVTNASEAAWAKHYNRAFADGQMGNLSVAIKMNDTADFSIKGMVFDGRSTAEMVKKVATQTIGIIAAAYGAPVSVVGQSEGGDSGAFQFSDSERQSASRTTIAQAEAEEKAYRAALFQVADTVLANFVGLRAGNATSEAIVSQIIAANRTRWSSPSED